MNCFEQPFSSSAHACTHSCTHTHTHTHTCMHTHTHTHMHAHTCMHTHTHTQTHTHAHTQTPHDFFLPWLKSISTILDYIVSPQQKQHRITFTVKAWSTHMPPVWNSIRLSLYLSLLHTHTHTHARTHTHACMHARTHARTHTHRYTHTTHTPEHTHTHMHTHTHAFHPSLSDYNLSLYINIHILHYLWNSSTSSEWMVWGNISTPTACTAWNGLPGWSSFSGTIRLKHRKFELLETNKDIRQMVQLPIQPQMICQYICPQNLHLFCIVIFVSFLTVRVFAFLKF